MNARVNSGFFGKLPGHGDFIYRDLPTQFMEVWDNWLQLFISSSQEQIGEGWLDIYLTSPIWRFALSEGVIDESAWMGIVLPSVDRVGRYFPFTIATRLPANSNPIADISTQLEWFENCEEIALQALNDELSLEEIVASVQRQSLVSDDTYVRNNQALHHSPLLMRMEFEEQSAQAVLPFMMDTCLRHSFSSYSVWSTKGSEYVEPCMFVSQAMPAITGIAAMLDGQWEHWNWPEPYRLNVSYEQPAQAGTTAMDGEQPSYIDPPTPQQFDQNHE